MYAYNFVYSHKKMCFILTFTSECFYYLFTYLYWKEDSQFDQISFLLIIIIIICMWKKRSN